MYLRVSFLSSGTKNPLYRTVQGVPLEEELRNCLAEFLACLEFGYIAGLDIDLRSRLRISTFASLTLRHGKRTETCQSDFIILLQGFGNVMRD